MLCVLQLNAVAGTWRLGKTDFLLAGVDKPQAQFQRSTSNLGHNFHRASGQEETLGLLSSQIRDKSCISIACATSCLFSFHYIASAGFLRLEETKKETVNSERLDSHFSFLFVSVFFTAVLLLVCSHPFSARISDFIMQCCCQGINRFNQRPNCTFATNHKYILKSIWISHRRNLSAETTELSVLHLV